MKLYWKVLFVILLVAGGYTSLAWMNTEEVDFVKVGNQVPEFKLETSEAKIDASSLKGKVVLVNFFATWCPPCVKELPHLEKEVWLPNKDNKDFVLLVVGREHSEEEIKAFADKRGLNLPFYPDPKREMFSMFAKQSIPRNYIIDREGKVVYSAVGFESEEFEKMKAVLKEQLN